MDAYRKGSKVEWKWGNGVGSGKIAEVFTEKVKRTINGSEITRDASKDDPAYLIEQSDGGRVLKGHGELTKAS
ncbi:DUF2945 domain-containing protein [Pararhizobium haloflavum]|uniref:DUF2945 domain-containing protein n=1 Tax=Pararhizobium haloflavum TaxID=2037914 RepID=UPI000C1971F9|nr:DUF2945 domain-containing protein [Pararhizobium haloflavum]